MLSPAQWCSSVQLLQLASLCLHGTYLSYISGVRRCFGVGGLIIIGNSISSYNELCPPKFRGVWGHAPPGIFNLDFTSF